MLIFCGGSTSGNGKVRYGTSKIAAPTSRLMRTLYLLRASNRLKETNANDVFKSGALESDPSFTDSTGLALGGWTRRQSQGQAGRPPTITGLDQQRKIKGPAWAAVQGGDPGKKGGRKNKRKYSKPLTK